MLATAKRIDLFMSLIINDLHIDIGMHNSVCPMRDMIPCTCYYDGETNASHDPSFWLLYGLAISTGSDILVKSCTWRHSSLLTVGPLRTYIFVRPLKARGPFMH